LKMPVLLQHGDADSLIPLSHAKRLKALRPESDLQVFASAGHELAFTVEAQAKSAAWLGGIYAAK
jgi:uncharacterized protein